MSKPEEARWEGREGRECGEHRALGGRAWCGECSEYCYPSDVGGCKGCRLPMLESRIRELEAERVEQARTFLAMQETQDRVHRELLDAAEAQVTGLEAALREIEQAIYAADHTAAGLLGIAIKALRRRAILAQKEQQG